MCSGAPGGAGTAEWPTIGSRLRDDIYNRLLETHGPDDPLVELWNASHMDGDVLVLPREKASEIAAAHRSGYRSGLWHLATTYEVLMAQACLSNSNPHARGYGEPKSFSAWPRQHDRTLYKQAAALLKDMPEELEKISAKKRSAYLKKIKEWHESVELIFQISGHTRLDLNQLGQLWRSISSSSAARPADHETFFKIGFYNIGWDARPASETTALNVNPSAKTCGSAASRASRTRRPRQNQQATHTMGPRSGRWTYNSKHNSWHRRR